MISPSLSDIRRFINSQVGIGSCFTNDRQVVTILGSLVGENYVIAYIKNYLRVGKAAP
jgi:hypothetical protein